MSFETTCKEREFLLPVCSHTLFRFFSLSHFQCRLSYCVCIAPVCTHTCMHAHTQTTHMHTHNMLLVHHTYTHTEKMCAVSHVWTIFDSNLVTEIVFSHSDFLMQTRRCVNMHCQFPYHQYIPLGPLSWQPKQYHVDAIVFHCRPGTYEHEIPRNRQVQWHQSFGGSPIMMPPITIKSTIQKNTDKVGNFSLLCSLVCCFFPLFLCCWKEPAKQDQKLSEKLQSIFLFLCACVCVCACMCVCTHVCAYMSLA